MIHNKESIPRALHQVGTADSLPERADLDVVCLSAEIVVVCTDPHMINIIDSDQLLQVVPIPKLGRIIMQQRAAHTPCWQAGYPPQGATHKATRLRDRLKGHKGSQRLVSLGANFIAFGALWEARW
jgi:hypothetical protein